MASKLYGVNATIIIFVFVLYCIVLYCIVLYCIVLYCRRHLKNFIPYKIIAISAVKNVGRRFGNKNVKNFTQRIFVWEEMRKYTKGKCEKLENLMKKQI